jgi:N-acetylglutamate synthase-like GNAT family acetyltransferase
MRLAREEELNDILDFLEPDLGNCVYLYMDIKKYGLNNKNMKVWVNNAPCLSSVVMRYYDSMQLYSSKEVEDSNEILECICCENVKMISAPKSLIELLKEDKRIREQYNSKDGYTFWFGNYRKFPYEEIETADVGDLKEIAELICMDEEFSGNYQSEVLERQLRERLLTGMGRNYKIQKDGKIIAHIATFAEEAQIAVTSGLIVHPQYRNFPYGTMLESYIVNVLQEEGFRVFTFINDKKRVKLQKALGHKECGQYEKLMRKEE